MTRAHARKAPPASASTSSPPLVDAAASSSLVTQAPSPLDGVAAGSAEPAESPVPAAPRPAAAAAADTPASVERLDSRVSKKMRLLEVRKGSVQETLTLSGKIDLEWK